MVENHVKSACQKTGRADRPAYFPPDFGHRGARAQNRNEEHQGDQRDVLQQQHPQSISAVNALHFGALDEKAQDARRAAQCDHPAQGHRRAPIEVDRHAHGNSCAPRDQNLERASTERNGPELLQAIPRELGPDGE